MKPWKFLYEYRKAYDTFIKPKFKFFIGKWINEPNLPVWRRGNYIEFSKYDERTEEWDYGRFIKSEWNELGKKNHPILSKILKPSYQLPIWLSFYFFNSDIIYKTKWDESDFIYEFPAHITLVLFGLAISITAYIPKGDENDFTCNDDYWESLLTFNYFDGDLRKTNEVMGYWNNPKDKNFKFRFRKEFLKNPVDKDDLLALQAEELPKIKEKEKNI